MTETGYSLEEVLAHGEGVERPFRCQAHDDSVASASVNVDKMVWHCFACQASGRVDPKLRTVPSTDDLIGMLQPEKAVRNYADAYLELFCDHDGYWNTRHDPSVSHALGMGTDPFTGDATFAVHSPRGTLAGVGRRRKDPADGPRYVYPRKWSAARTLGGTMGRFTPAPIVCLVEGMADAAAVNETGCVGLAVYGSGLHVPQVELLARYNPAVVLLGFDMDEAGERGVTGAYKLLGSRYQLKRVHWPAKDPGESTIDQRTKALVKAVTATDYVGDYEHEWSRSRWSMADEYTTHMEEDHAPA